jgi:tRNA pseudouridine55 synthase
MKGNEMAPAPAGRRGVDGYVVVDKEPGWTSHDVVARCRRIFGERRIGHAGTLDPGATGVLVVGVGAATRLLRFASALGKSYVGELVLGLETSTLDAHGVVVARHDMSGVGFDDVAGAALSLTGRIMQVPPMVSAVKVGGRRLHELAREGIEVERAPRPVTVSRFDVSPCDETGVFAFSVDCSSGTYVRVLAADLGQALGGGAYLRTLRRVAVGSFLAEDAVLVGSLDPGALGPIAELVRDYPSVVVGAELADGVRHGRVCERAELSVAGDGPWAVLDESGQLLAMYEPRGANLAKPAVVLPPVVTPRRPASRPAARPATSPRAGGTAVTIGAFDGVHLGHRRLIGELRKVAEAQGLRPVVVTFDRHPATVVRPESAPLLLTDVTQKLELLRAEGVDEVVVIRFDEERAQESAEDFVRGDLVDKLDARLVLVGSDFHFGRGRNGNVDLLEKMGAELGFSVIGYSLVSAPGDEPPVSSTRIRALVAEGAVEDAARLLGRSPELRGTVVSVSPAVAIDVAPGVVIPADGRYRVEVRPDIGPDDPPVPAVACVAEIPGPAGATVALYDAGSVSIGDEIRYIGSVGSTLRLRFV